MPLSQCAITGTIFDAEGNALSGVTVYAYKVIKAGALIIEKLTTLDTSDSNGQVSFTLPRASTAYIYAQAHGLNVPSRGVALTIPDAASATLESLLPVVSVPPTPTTFNFLALFDTPDTYAGQGGKVVGVKSDVSGLEFVDIATDAEVATAVAAEAALRSSADATLQTNITNEATARAAADTTLQTNITNEASSRAAADTTLQNNINSEASTRASTDAALQSDIDDEAAARAIADTALQSNITAEATARANADTTLQTNIDGKQSLDSDLTAIAALAPSNDDVLQRKSGAWTNRTPAQLKTDLALSKSDVGLSAVDNTSDLSKPVSTAQQTALDAKANLSGGNSFSGVQSVSSNSATALTVGANGSTNPALQVDASTASSVSGLKIKSAPAGAGVALSAISSGGNEHLSIYALGAGNLYLSKPLGGAGFYISTVGHFLAQADNSYDIGASGATRPRTGYFGTSVVAPKLNLSATVTPSSSADAQGSIGDVRYDDNYVYVKTSAGWKRAALSTF